MPLAMRTDAIDQILAVAMHPGYDWKIAKVSMEIFSNLAESPETHAYLVRRDRVENMLKVIEQRFIAIIQRASLTHQQRKQEDLMFANVQIQRYVTIGASLSTNAHNI